MVNTVQFGKKHIFVCWIITDKEPPKLDKFGRSIEKKENKLERVARALDVRLKSKTSTCCVGRSTSQGQVHVSE